LASDRLSVVLELDLASSTCGWKETNQQGSAIHGELLKLGFDISERSVSRWVKHAKHDPDPARLWLAFLRNHREAIAAMDFFTVPTLTFGVLYCFFVIGHDRRTILHCNVTRQPNALWIVLQLREAWGSEQPHRFLIFDRDAKFCADVMSAIRKNATEPVRTAFRSPWQKGYASYCTSCVPCMTFSGKRHRSESLIPCALRGGFGPGSSYSHSFSSHTG
jgi:hypothetical protein